MVRVSIWNDGLAVAVTGGGSVLPGNGLMEIRSLAIVLRTWSVTLAWVSPGIRRKLTVASALPGSTLSLSPALKMVSAVVVRTVASAGPVFATWRRNSGLNSQRFDSTTRL